MAEAGLHISISAEELFKIGRLSINNSIFTSIIVSCILIIIAFIIRSKLTNTSHPTGWQNFGEWLVESLYNLVHSVTNDGKKSMIFFPWVASFFLFILINNWIGLFPGVGSIGLIKKVETTAKPISKTVDQLTLASNAYASTTTENYNDDQQISTSNQEEHATKFVPLLRAGTADLNTTLALAILSVVLTQVFGFMHQGLGYLKKFINFSNPILFFVGILEIISEFAKIISFSFRLFGNIFAGEVLIGVVLYLIPFLAPIPFYGLEVFVGFIQALVFAMLSLVFFNMATQGHQEH